MIETLSDCETFFNCIDNGDLILHVIPKDESSHPCDTTPLLLMLYCISTKKCHSISFGHPDSSVPIDVLSDFTKRLIDYSGKKWVVNSKIFNQLIYCGYVHDINLASYLTDNTIVDVNEHDTQAHLFIRHNSDDSTNYTKAIPIIKHKEAFCSFCKSVISKINEFKVDNGYKCINDILIPALREIEYNGLYVDTESFIKHFEQEPDNNGIVRCQYNVYTSTGRPSNAYSGINYSALNTTDGSRECFISRHGENGILIEIDYSSFHPRIVALILNHTIEGNIYEYLAKLYFNKSSVTDEEVAESKRLTFKQFYGGIEEKYLHIKFLSKLNNYIRSKWEFFKSYGFVLTPMFNKRITSFHIKDASPNKLFNYILQATESEIINTVLVDIHSSLRPYKSKPVLTTYDSILFDIYTPELNDILPILEQKVSMDGKFPIKIKKGKNYNNMSDIT